ncbi:pantoate--beta-alanine ligase [Mameliella alba]|uniref:pantoate--beta-alanine ligase n=1 Tax=Mameliella alba TaxID=561184 RepID=UPI00089220A3|nr:pantoate--beta-alanine ligase [Mameliella alba]OWV47157.1 pantoate--beta-alanine ligase [Mameliella alba]PTR38696.1 pantothenate synthetase [Mameliella alba]GGF68624.1 pantothenate synthetase [Mameliella alba]SDD39227.1 pantoate--beta-alanine ligase [Mameliella alba]
MIAPIIRSVAELRQLTDGWHRAGDTIGAVPTMGALHDGHLSLVAAAKERCERVIVTIFVNPRQFNSREDYEKYPRTEHDDARKLERFAVDAIFVPDGGEMYPQGFATGVSVSGLTDVLCGAHRPGHFDGVATVVTKLLLQTAADRAFFGEKDWQQLQVVRRLVADLNIPAEIVGCPTIREIDGLAMSSRNLLLSDRARARAAALNEALEEMAEGLRGGRAAQDLRPAAEARLSAAGFTEVEYLDLRANDDLSLLERPERPARLLVAAWLAGVRLIDNIAV